MASSSGIKLGRAYVLIDAVDRTKQACNAALRNISTLADNVMAIGTNMTIGATIAVTLDASASRAFREFEETMLKVKAKSKDTAGATVAAYDRLIEKAQQLGRVTKFTAPQIADAMAGMAAAGLSRSTIDKSIKNVLDLAVATGVEIPTASRIAMAAMQQFNMTAEQSAEICDVLSAAVNNSALTIEDIGETFKYSAPLAREFGMDIKQLATVIAALGNAGIKGSQAGTSLRQMMVKLAKPGKYNLEQFNKDFEANVQRDIVVNEGGVLRKKTRPVIEILRDMGRAMDEFEKKHPDVDPQKKLAVFADLFGRYAMTSGATLADNMKNLDTLMKAINNSSGTAGKTAEIMNSGVVGMHYAFISAWQDVAIQYGKAINETVMAFYEGFTKIAHYISNFIQNNQNVINIITGVTAATGALGVSMIAGAGAVKTFAVVGGMFTSTVGAMSSAAYGFAIALNSWINPLISAEGLLRGLVATMTGVSVVGRGVGGVLASFAPRWNLPWQAVPAGASRLTVAQAGKARGLLSAYYARSLAEGLPAGTLHAEIAARETARVAAIKRSLTHEGMLETLNSRVRNPRMRNVYGNYHRTSIARTAAADALNIARSTEHAKEVSKTVRGQAREAVKTITGKHKTFLDLAKSKEKEIKDQYNSKLNAIKKGSSNEAIRMNDRAEARAFNAYNAARTTRRGLEHNRRVLNKAIGMEQMLLASGTLGEAESKLAKDKIRGYRRSLKNTEKSLGEIRTVEDKALQKYKVHKEHGLALRDKYEPAVANRIRRLDASRDAALAAVAARKGTALSKVEQYKQFAKTGYKDTVARKLEREIARAEGSLTRATAARDAATATMRTETARRRGVAPRRRTIYDPWLALNSPNERMSSRLVGQRGWRSTNFLRGGMTNDYGRNAQYLRERMRMLRLAGFHDLTRNQALMRSAELIRTRRLMTSNNMALGRARWGAFFRPFTDAMRRATRAVGEFSMRMFSSISRIGLHPIRGARSIIANAGSMLFAGLAPGGGIMKGIGSMFKGAFSILKAGLVPLMKLLLALSLRIAASPMTWVIAIGYATLQAGKLKDVLATVYIGISAIGMAISKIGEGLHNVLSWVGKKIRENMAMTNDIIDPVMNMWKNTFTRLFDNAKSSFGTISKAIGAGRWGDVWEMLKATWGVIRAELSATLRANWEHMKLVFMETWNRVVDYFQNGEGLWGIVKWTVSGLWEIAKYLVSGIFNGVSWGLAEFTGYGHQAQIGNTQVWTRYNMVGAEAQYMDSISNVLRELGLKGITLDLDKYSYIKKWIEHQRYAHTYDDYGELHVDQHNSGSRKYITSVKRNGVWESLDKNIMASEYQQLLLDAQAAFYGKDFTNPAANGGGMFGAYTPEQLAKQKENLEKIGKFDEKTGTMSIRNAAEVVQAYEEFDKTQRGVEGNIERQEAAKAAQQLKEREEGVVKELGEEGVGRIAGLLEGFYDFSDVSENRKKGLILAAGEYITEMGISIDKFAEIIETIKKLPGFGGSANAKLFSEKSNIELFANLADNTIRAGMDALTEDSFKDGIKFKLTDSKGNSVEKVLNREKDGTLQTRFEQLKELGDVLATLSPDQKRDVRAQFVGQYGEPATSAIENALDVINERNISIDFSEEERLYRHNANGATEFDKLSEYEKSNIDERLKARMPDGLNLSEENSRKLKEAIAKEVFGSAQEVSVDAVAKAVEYTAAFGTNKALVDTYVPEKQNLFAMPANLENAWSEFTLMDNQGITPDETKFVDMLIESGEINDILKKNGYNAYRGSTTSGFAMLRYLEDQFNTKELDRKMRYYGIDTEGMSTVDKLGALKEKEGEGSVVDILRKDVGKTILAGNGGDMKAALDVLKEQVPIFEAFAEWVKSPGKADDEKPQIYSVVQAHLRGMLDTFKAFTENRNRVILDRRAKAEKDAKAAEEAKKKEAGEDVEGRLKKIQAGIDDLAGCVEGKGSNAFNVNLEYA